MPCTLNRLHLNSILPMRCNGGMSISAAKWHPAPELISSFDSLTLSFVGTVLEFYVYLPPFKSYSVF